MVDAISSPTSLSSSLSKSDNIPSSLLIAGKTPSLTPTINKALTSLPFILAISPILTWSNATGITPISLFSKPALRT